MQNYNSPNIQAPSTNSNSFQLIPRLTAIALFQNLLFVGFFYILAMIANTLSNSGGLAGLAFLLAYINVASYIAQFIVVMVSGMLLKWAGFSQPFKIAIVAFVLSLVGGLISVFLLDGQTQIVTISVGFLASIIYYLGAYWLIKVSTNKYALYIGIPVSLVAIGAIILYAQIPLANRYLKNTNNDKVAKLDFEVYKPSYLPAGFRLGPDYISSLEGSTFEYTILTGPNKSDYFTTYQNRHSAMVDKLIAPPDVCFIAIAQFANSGNSKVPDRESTACIEKTTPGGITYYREDKNTHTKNAGERYFYIRKGNTGIFMHLQDSNFRYSDSFEPELQKIIDSFQVQSIESLKIK